MIRDVPGVPRWVVRFGAWRGARQCRRAGAHRGVPVRDGVCTRCGYVWFTAGDPLAD